MKIGLAMFTIGHIWLALCLYALVHQAIVEAVIAFVIGLPHVACGYGIVLKRDMREGK